MKVTLEFDGHEDKEELEAALKANKYCAILFDLEQEIFRNARKYESFNGRQLAPDEVKLFEEIEKCYYELKSGHLD